MVAALLTAAASNTARAAAPAANSPCCTALWCRRHAPPLLAVVLVPSTAVRVSSPGRTLPLWLRHGLPLQHTDRRCVQADPRGLLLTVLLLLLLSVQCACLSWLSRPNQQAAAAAGPVGALLLRPLC